MIYFIIAAIGVYSSALPHVLFLLTAADVFLFNSLVDSINKNNVKASSRTAAGHTIILYLFYIYLFMYKYYVFGTANAQ